MDVVPEDEILSLVTCCYDFENARLVVMARRVRDGEDPTVDTASARENKSARFPKKWYEVKKKEYPYAAEGISVQDVPSASSELSGSSEPVGEQPPGPAENGSNQAPSAEAASGSTGSSEEPNGFAP